MLVLKISSVDGAELAKPVEASFGEAGGTIGRAETNDMVLPDPSRRISRVHARVQCTDGVYELRDEGANPVEHNGRQVGPGNSVRLGAGDRLHIGNYELVVTQASSERPTSPGTRQGAAPATDPFGGLFDAPPPAQAVSSRGASPAPVDPLGLNLPAAPSPVSGLRPAVIPDDFDPFTTSVRESHPPKESPQAQDLSEQFDLGIGPRGSPALSIDEMFGLKPDADPLADGPLSKPVVGSAPVSLDPMEPWNGPAPSPAPAPVSDHVPEIRGAFRAPQVAAPDVQARRPVPAQPSDTGAFFSWEQPAPDAAPPRKTAKATEQPLPAQAQPAHEVVRPPAPAPAPAPVPGPAAEARAVAASDELTRAFLAGAGLPDLPLPSLTPQAMHGIGVLLREATQGTLELLVARALIKQQMRAEVTTIAGKDNNPLKFSPNVEMALSALLLPRGSGFLQPAAAMRDAYDDLRSHQLAFTAGLRAALAGVFARFDPEQIERLLSGKSLLDNVLPMNRKARLWDQYEHFFREIAAQAEDDFHSLFGREFVRAYEAEMDRLDRESDMGKD